MATQALTSHQLLSFVPLHNHTGSLPHSLICLFDPSCLHLKALLRPQATDPLCYEAAATPVRRSRWHVVEGSLRAHAALDEARSAFMVP